MFDPVKICEELKQRQEDLKFQQDGLKSLLSSLESFLRRPQNFMVAGFRPRDDDSNQTTQTPQQLAATLDTATLNWLQALSDVQNALEAFQNAVNAWQTALATGNGADAALQTVISTGSTLTAKRAIADTAEQAFVAAQQAVQALGG